MSDVEAGGPAKEVADLLSALQPETFTGVPNALNALAASVASGVIDLSSIQQSVGYTLPTGAMLHLFEALVRSFGGVALSLGSGRGVFEALVERYSSEYSLGKEPVQVIATDDVRGVEYGVYNDRHVSTELIRPRVFGDLSAGKAVARYGAEASVLFMGWPPCESLYCDDSTDWVTKRGLMKMAKAVEAWVAEKKKTGAPYAVVVVEEMCTGGPSLEEAFERCGLELCGFGARSALSQGESHKETRIHDRMDVYTADAESWALAEEVAEAFAMPARFGDCLSPAARSGFERD